MHSRYLIPTVLLFGGAIAMGSASSALPVTVAAESHSAGAGAAHFGSEPVAGRRDSLGHVSLGLQVGSPPLMEFTGGSGGAIAEGGAFLGGRFIEFAAEVGSADGPTFFAVDTNGGIDDIAIVSATLRFDIEPLSDRNGIVVNSFTSGSRQWLNREATGGGSAVGIAGVSLDVSQDLRRVLVEIDGDTVAQNFLPLPISPDGRLEAGSYGSGAEDYELAVFVNDQDLGGEQTSGTVRLEFVVWIDGDVDFDGRLEFSDLVSLLASWGVCADADDCPADLDGDGLVDLADLLILLSLLSSQGA